MEGESLVIIIRNAAATAKIKVTKLRGNVSVLQGSGGNRRAYGPRWEGPCRCWNNGFTSSDNRSLGESKR
jgi:hypothetical protein